MNENAQNPILSVRDLRVSFHLDEGIVKAVDGVSFDVHPGQVLGIVGESGCGKSVTMKAVLRILDPMARIDDGQIWFRRSAAAAPQEMTDLATLDDHGREMRAIRGGEIALIPQEPMAAFSPVHTVGFQMMEGIMLHRKMNKEEARQLAVETFRAVGISMPEQRLDAYSWQLSGGLRQRAMIGMALSCDPNLLIADEPTTAIDVTTQAQILRLLRRLQRERNLTIIFITHDLGVIARIASHVVVMYLGKVVEKGTVRSIFTDPKHPYTRALLKSIPSAQDQRRIHLPTISGSIPHPFNRPKGCAFHPRCANYMPGKCDKGVPALVELDDDRHVACFLYSEAEEVA